ncbi:MAG: hypothetical protein ACYTFY_20005, partial [Planctomycetota bacterium]
GFIISVALITVCFFVAGWSMRLSVFGFIFSTDMLLLRKCRTKIDNASVRAFSNKELKDKVPMRTYGTLSREDGKLLFRYRPWLILSEQILEIEEKPENLILGTGLINAFIVKEGDDITKTLLRLSPRYNSHEEELKTLFNFRGIKDISILRGIKSLFAHIKSFFAGTPQPVS